jgi:membrane associated rhomboid family serine protease
MFSSFFFQADNQVNRIMDWRDTSQFPASDGTWAVVDGKTRRDVSQPDIARTARKVGSQLGVGGPLVASPSTQRFLPAIRVPELQDSVLASVTSGLKVLAWIALAVSVLGAALLLVLKANDTATVVRTAILAALISGYWFFQHRVATRDRATFLEWTIFLDWQRRFAGLNLRLPLAVIAAFGLLQLAAAVAGLDRDFLFYKFGVVFASIDQGEYWRFLIGPFLHASVAHWAMNLAFCLLVLPYLTPFKDQWGVLLIGYAAIVLSAVGAYAFDAADSFAGVSALIYYACGFAITNALANKDWYPRQYTTGLVVSTLILVASPHVVSGSISFTAHAIGLLTGLVAGRFFEVRK